MKKLLFILTFVLLNTVCWAQQDTKYLAGAIQENNGKVFLERTVTMKGLSRNEIFRIVDDWAQRKYAPEEEFVRKVLSVDTVNTAFSILGDEYIVFRNSALSLDRTRIIYALQIKIADGKCSLNFSRIRYLYNVATSPVPEKYTAEEMISDKVALKKNKLVRTSDKFRIKTIDLADQIVEELNVLLGKATLDKINSSNGSR